MRILVVDDSKLDRLIVEELLGREPGFEVECVASGRDALASLERSLPDAVVTDLVMPEMDGLEIVAHVHETYPAVPTILMTSRGSEEIAVQALQAGASSYVPKRVLEEHLLTTVNEVVELSRERDVESQLLGMVRRSAYEYCIADGVRFVRPLVRHLQEAVLRMGLCDRSDCTQVAVALHEAIFNAAEHGNLEIDSGLRETSLAAYNELIDERSRRSPYQERRIYVEAELDREQARFTIRDEGPGFDPDSLPDPRDPANLEKLSGRGVLLMRTFMDEVTYDTTGSEVTLVKRRKQPDATGSAR
jgi:CheY-like chemotaxis protein